MLPLMNQPLPLILLSGMGADSRLFSHQIEEIPELITPAWIPPLPRESLPAYAVRLANSIDPGRPCVVGGASFGGIVALEMAVHLQAAACVLISSVRSPAEFPWWYRVLRPVACLGPEGLAWVAGLVAGASELSLGHRTAAQLRRLSRAESEFLRWASWAVLRWSPSTEVRRLRIHHIHGDSDRTFPVRLTRPDVIVAGAGHVLTLSHPQEVNEFLRRVMALQSSSTIPIQPQ